MRPAQEVMAALASSGLSPEQLALVMELSAAVATEARPTVDRAAENKRAYDREYRKAHARNNRTKSYEQDEPGPSPNERDNLTPTRKEKSEPNGSSKKAWACPDGVDPEHWRDFLKNRRTKHLTNSETAYRGQLRALEELSDDEWPPGRLVEHAAEKGWGSINDPRTPKHGQPANVTSLRGTRPDPALDLLRAASAAEDSEDRWRARAALPPISTSRP